MEKEPSIPLSLISDADAEKKRAAPWARPRAIGIGSYNWSHERCGLLATISPVGVVVARSPVGIVGLASVVKSPAARDVT